MSEPDSFPPPRRHKPLKPFIDPNHRRPPSGRLGEEDLINDTHGSNQILEPDTSSRWWMAAFAVVFALILAGFGLLVVASESSESPKFRALAEEALSQQLRADVEIAPTQASSFFFLRTPEIRITGRNGAAWSISIRNVSLELNRKSLMTDQWEFRNFLASEVEVDLGRRSLEDLAASESAPSFAARLAQRLNIGPFSAPTTVQIPELRVGTLRIRGWEGTTSESPGFELEAPVRAAYDDGTLSFETGAGLWKMGIDALPWEVEAFAATLAPGAGGVSIEAGRLRGPSGASVEIQHRNREDAPAADEVQQLLLGVEAENIPIHQPGSGESLDPAIKPMIAKGRGELRIPIDSPLDFQFLGAFEFGGLQLGRSELFELLANQTGDDRLRRMNDKTLAAEVDWNPERLALRRVVMESNEIVRLDGAVSITGGQLSGELQFEFPTDLITRMPGGKPKGFSYPASGWSQAKVQIGGTLAKVEEDLSKRLLVDIAPDVTVSAAPLTDAPSSPGRSLNAAKIAERLAQIEKLFYQLLESEETEEPK